MKLNKPKTCKICQREYLARSSTAQVCSMDCAIQFAAEKNAKDAARIARAARVATRQAIKQAKPLSWYKKRAQTAVNAFICLRDKLAGHGCITCGTNNPNIQYAAGHYRTVKAAGQLRYNEDNIHRQCNKRCNLELSGNIREYRPRLVERIGQERFDAIENDNSTKRWTIPELEEMTTTYRKRLRELMKEMA